MINTRIGLYRQLDRGDSERRGWSSPCPRAHRDRDDDDGDRGRDCRLMTQEWTSFGVFFGEGRRQNVRQRRQGTALGC